MTQIRRQLALRESIGITEIYNRFHKRNDFDADIEQLRILHQRLGTLFGGEER